MPKIKTAQDLNESIHCTAEIQCGKCLEKDTTYCVDEDEGAQRFFDKGWRATPYNTYCPNCVKKYHIKP